MNENPKGENWPKYLNELQELQPLLRKHINEDQVIARKDYHPILAPNGAIINDPLVKKREKNQLLGKDGKVLDQEEKGKRFAILSKDGNIASSTITKMQKASEKLKANTDKVARFIHRTINGWIEENVKRFFTPVEWRAIQEGQKWPIKKRKIEIETDHRSDPLPIGSDLVVIFKNGKPVAHQIFRWEFDYENF